MSFAVFPAISWNLTAKFYRHISHPVRREWSGRGEDTRAIICHVLTSAGQISKPIISQMFCLFPLAVSLLRYKDASSSMKGKMTFALPVSVTVLYVLMGWDRSGHGFIFCFS